MKEAIFRDRGIAYRVNQFEAGRTTLVLIHGLSGSASAWYAYEETLSAKYNLLTLDLRGHGLSKKYPHYRDYAVENSADDIYALLDFLNITSCVLISHSYGALVALALMHAHPELVSRAMFLSPMAYPRAVHRYTMTSVLVAPLITLLGLFPQASPRGRVDYSSFTHTSDYEPRRVLADLRATSLFAYLGCFRQSYTFDSDGLWSEIKVPTLIMHGTHDSYIPLAHAERLAASLPHATLITLLGANHITVLNNRPEVLAAIQTFLT